jgi:hypothetical protein
METIRGKTSLDLDLNGLTARLTNYQRVILDLGTGDGRYVRFLAEKNPDWFVIGVDACRENLYEHSRAKLDNMLFIIACAQELPCELNGLVSHITIHFPWGSLLASLLSNDEALLCGLSSIAQKDAQIDVFLNGGALAEIGVELEDGAARIYENLLATGWRSGTPVAMGMDTLRRYPTTWARRLAHGRDPRAMSLSGMRKL